MLSSLVQDRFLSRATEEKHEEKIVEEINLGGFKYLAEKNTTVRIIWASVIVVFLALTLYQISTQIAKYVRNPISTNVEVEYPQKINFPAIAICNNNQFRQSYLLSEEFRELAHPDGTPDSKNLYFEQIIKVLGDRPAMPFLRDATHELSTLIASCILPNGTECRPEMWTQLWTVNGICWALNMDLEKPFEITDAGPSHGLKLVLNAESYERTDTCGRVLNSEAETGFKILIFNQTDRPITTAEGVTVSPGISVNIPFRIKRRSKLPGPNCRAESDASKAAGKDLTSPDNIRACLGRILHEKFEKKCNCSIRGLFTGEKVIKNECDIEMYFSCVLPYQHRLHSNLTAEVGQQCLPACETMEYVPTQDIGGLPKRLFPRVNDTEAFVSNDELEVQRVEKRFLGLATNGTRLFEQVTVNCDDSTFISKDFADRILEKSRDVLEERARVDLVERETVLRLINSYEQQQDAIADKGWPWKEKDDRSFPLVDMLLNMTDDCSEMLWAFNESSAFGDSRAIDWLVRRKPADVVKRIPLREFELDEAAQKWGDGEFSKYELADFIQAEAVVRFFHEEFQRYWSQPIQDFHDEARQALTKEKDELAKIIRARFGDENNSSHFYVDPTEVDACLVETEDNLILIFQQFRQLARQLGIAFDRVYKDHFGDYYKKCQIDADFERQNMAIVNIYLQSNTIESWTQNEDYTFWTLACDVGGALGLFLGASVVTILEIIYVLYQHRTKHQHAQRAPHPPDDVKMKQLRSGAAK